MWINDKFIVYASFLTDYIEYLKGNFLMKIDVKFHDLNTQNEY